MGSIDYDGLAKLFIESLPEDEKTILAFGMIPKNNYDGFLDTNKNVFTELAMERFGIKMDDKNRKKYRDYLDKDFLVKFEHELSVAIYRNANMVV